MWDLTRAATGVAVVVGIALSPGVGGAQGPPAGVPPVPRLFGTFHPAVGAWSEYVVTEKAAGTQSIMKMAIVGREGDAYWYEVTLHEKGHRNIVKMLVDGNPNEPDNIERLILKSGDNPAVEMPREFVAMGRRMASHMFEKRSGVAADAGSTLKSVEAGRGELTVPAGTFQVIHQRVLDADGRELARYDFNAEVLPFGVVLSQAGDTRMVLLDNGDDAQTTITETPTPLSGPPAMPGGLPRGAPPGMPPPAPSGLRSN